MNCEICDKKFVNNWGKYFDKNICYNCDDDYCQRCQQKLTINTETQKCSLCCNMYCDDCIVAECDICNDNDGLSNNNRCFNCYGSIIELCCGHYSCIQCIMFKNDDQIQIKYCTKHDNYVCPDSDCSKNEDHTLVSVDQEPINPINYILNNGNKCFPQLNKYMYYMVEHPG
jgi:hypothetical protein